MPGEPDMGAEAMTRPPADRWRAALVIAAHPDDEVIWCGGLILRHPEWDWTVLSLCGAAADNRRPKFDRVCERLQAQGIISDLHDGNPLLPVYPPATSAGASASTPAARRGTCA